MVQLPFEVVGPLSAEWEENLVAYAGRLAEHPWGGAGLQRLVIGGMNESLSVWMRPQEYERWRASQGVRSVITGGKSFLAADGRWTAVVPPFDERSLFLHFPAHEMIEAALDRRQAAEGYEFVDSTHSGVAHVLWTEYVVERTRKGIANELGWPASKLDDGFLVDHANEFEQSVLGFLKTTAATGTEPVQSFQHWYELVRVYAMSRGRADAGSPADEASLSAFFHEAIPAELRDQWQWLDDALRDAYARPQAPTSELDALTHDEGWRPLHEEYRRLWSFLLRSETP